MNRNLIRMEITLDEIAEILSLSAGKADELGALVTIALFDAHGNLKTCDRIDDGSDPQALLTAIACAQEVRSTIRLNIAWGICQNDLLTGSVPAAVHNDSVLYLSQGLPIYRDGIIIGYIGVAGASATQNLVIAIAGASIYSRFAYRQN